MCIELAVNNNLNNRYFYKLVDFTTFITKIVLAILMSAIIVNISADIFYRYVLVNPLNWSNQLAKYLMVWFAFLGSSLAVREGAHISTDVLLRRLSEVWRKYLLIISCFGVTIFLIVVIFWGFYFAYGLRQDIDPLLGIKIIYPFLAVPIGSIFMLIQVMWVLIEAVRNKK